MKKYIYHILFGILLLFLFLPKYPKEEQLKDDFIKEIVNDEEENSFVRMYAAEALGKMKKEEAVPILVKLFEEGDPNMRQYCVKGLSNFSNNDEAKAVILHPFSLLSPKGMENRLSFSSRRRDALSFIMGYLEVW